MTPIAWYVIFAKTLNFFRNDSKNITLIWLVPIFCVQISLKVTKIDTFRMGIVLYATVVTGDLCHKISR